MFYWTRRKYKTGKLTIKKGKNTEMEERKKKGERLFELSSESFPIRLEEFQLEFHTTLTTLLPLDARNNRIDQSVPMECNSRRQFRKNL